jgi:hypothetical protein
MKPDTNHLAPLLPVSLALLVVVCFGCWKPGAQRETELLAAQVKNEAGCTDKLRQWFATVASMPHAEKSFELLVPESLNSGWWRSAKAYAVWAGDGSLVRINVTHGVYEPFVIVGAATATPDSLGFKQRAGDPPSFYAQVTTGIYTHSGNYK